MSYQVLARKWRPRNFEQIVGQAHVVRALSNALDADRLHHAFLFAGTRGVGKTTIARILAKCLNCEQGVASSPCGTCSACVEIDEGRYMDLIEVDAASRSKVEETRELMDNVQFAPGRGRYKVYLIDEVHMFSEKSFNALLKTLEEPPPHVKFLFATTDPQKLPVTVLSRCLQFNLKRLPASDIATYLSDILAQEGIEAEPSGIRRIAGAADGSMRDALSLLDQAVSYGGGKILDADVRAMLGTLDRSHVYALLEALAAGDGAGVMARIDEMASEVTDYSEALAELTSELQRIAVTQVVPDAAPDDEDAPSRKALAARLSAEDVQLYYQMGIMSGRDLALAPDPRSGFEMALLRMLAFRPAASGAASATGSGAAGASGSHAGPGAAVAGTRARAPSPQ
ncbi:MAG: DNA polymerase III subunit gamma/tau, partial [Gammaproteobacteria bacterium]|nr:DNA polymerase III subunit gamma/tau [Gammaproteobacteria bacterium]NIM71769.1 DNA polymerase III subunit gamma/tau [Gammaproteobacteria bacterium]NIN37865.1 DNA polymerase III subunit gamma/tau [Gammaproteobacteria bacterium]NIO23525.1 DNA polymerase III subunit gamma/tau [Gammaproteobacteria bacterium]NIO64141.1 DNA polymerase III subunit gamma/tau [Gammaproteobacteria bacterium]